MTVSGVRTYIPESVRQLRKEHGETDGVASFLDPRWDSLGESQLRKWIRSHEDVGDDSHTEPVDTPTRVRNTPRRRSFSDFNEHNINTVDFRRELERKHKR